MILDRIKQYYEYKGIPVAAFEKSIGVSNGALSKQIKKKGATIGSDKLENILIKYDDINPDWLLTGRGEMLREENPFSKEAIDKMAAARPNATPQQIISALAAIIRQQAQEIEQLKASLQAANAI